jgi:uncharacterized membrane protein
VIHSPFALLAFLFFLVALTRYLEQQSKLLKKITSAVLCTLTGIVLANIGLIPHRSVIYEGVFDVAIPYAIVLVVLASNFKELVRAGPRLLLAFGLAGLGTFAGAFLGGLAFGSFLGPEMWKLSGQFVGAFFGGGMNYAAIGRELGTTPSLFAAGAVVINLPTVPWLLAQMGLANVLKPYYGSMDDGTPDTAATAGDEPDDDPRREWTRASLSITDLSILGALPLAILWSANELEPFLAGFPKVLWITTIALVVAQVPAIRKLKGASFLSYFAMHLFFIVIGAQSIVSEVLSAGPAMLFYMLTVLAVHALVLFGSGWLLELDIGTVSIASQAAVGGPGSALALSMSMNWSSLLMPGVIIGIFGYAFGNYLGFICAYLVRMSF